MESSRDMHVQELEEGNQLQTIERYKGYWGKRMEENFKWWGLEGAHWGAWAKQTTHLRKMVSRWCQKLLHFDYYLGQIRGFRAATLYKDGIRTDQGMKSKRGNQKCTHRHTEHTNTHTNTQSPHTHTHVCT
mmetsp:Transcript_2459/g.4559  ORF Transcript_2459/g.4559 Transcript_2459/m.4559 type:complete len:131 (+) Transcript_2459:219-611(+)